MSEDLILANVLCMCMFGNLHKSSGWSGRTRGGEAGLH